MPTVEPHKDGVALDHIQAAGAKSVCSPARPPPLATRPPARRPAQPRACRDARRSARPTCTAVVEEQVTCVIPLGGLLGQSLVGFPADLSLDGAWPGWRYATSSISQASASEMLPPENPPRNSPETSRRSAAGRSPTCPPADARPANRPPAGGNPPRPAIRPPACLPAPALQRDLARLSACQRSSLRLYWRFFWRISRLVSWRISG